MNTTEVATTDTKTTATLPVQGAVLTYDIRPGTDSALRPLMIIGSPMGASGFGTLSGHFTDRTIITYDPRGVERSTKDDPTSLSTPEQHADDIHQVIQKLGLGPVDLFASSGGAVNALALVAAHPADVHTLVAHEPPLAFIVPDHEAALAACRAVGQTYQQHGWGAGLAHFITLVSYQGLFTPEFAAQPGPDPAMFGMPAADDGTRTDPLLAQNLSTCTAYQPDVPALKSASTSIVVGVGATSGAALARRAGEAVAELLGTQPVEFPGGHDGFLGGEFGQTGEPVAFAAKLHEVLDA